MKNIISRLFSGYRSSRKGLNDRTLSELLDDKNPQESFIHAYSMYKSGETDDAFSLLNEMKLRKLNIKNIDFLRARIFIDNNQKSAAIEALKEEIRYFPLNIEAKEMLESLNSATNIKEDGYDSEFLEMRAIVLDYTMLGNKRLYSLYKHAKYILDQDLPGNFVECGVAAGGSSALLAALIKLYSKRPRKHYAFDSFEGMPEPTDKDRHGHINANDTGWGEGTCAAPVDSLIEVCRRLDVSNIVVPVKGLFNETLPPHQKIIGDIALLHMDGDWYSSTHDILRNLYENVVDGGRIQVDDYGYWDGCRQAIDEFFAENYKAFNPKIIDGTGIWFEKISIPINTEHPPMKAK